MARKVRWAVEFANLKQAKLSFAELGRAISREPNAMYRSVSVEITKAYAAAANMVRDKARLNAFTGGVPRRLFAGSRPAIFAFTDFNATADNKRLRSSMVGVRTGAPPRKDKNLYVEWGKKGQGLKGMSLARIFESGTHRGIKPRRFFRSAIFSTRGKVLSMLAAAYNSATARFR